jgi:hypothetical protein
VTQELSARRCPWWLRCASGASVLGRILDPRPPALTRSRVIADGNLNATLITSEYSPALKPAEHSAAVSDDIRAEVERGFQENPPAYNVPDCTPTLELGVNIGDLEAVSMRNVPPKSGKLRTAGWSYWSSVTHGNGRRFRPQHSTRWLLFRSSS